MVSTLSETLPTSSASRRSLTIRAVTLEPLSRPTSGEVLVPMVIEIAGSSTWISGSATGLSASASVSPMVMSGKPATATMSPGPADSPGLRSRPSVTSSSVTRTFCLEPSRFIQATVWPLLSSPWWMRSRASRPRNGEASRLVTWACSGAPSAYVGAGMVSTIVRNSGSRSGESGIPPLSGTSSEARPAFADA